MKLGLILIILSCISLYLRCKVNLNAESQDNITPLVTAAQNESSGAFQLLMHLMDKPNRTIFKMMDLTVNHAQILTVSFGKLYIFKV